MEPEARLGKIVCVLGSVLIAAFTIAAVCGWTPEVYAFAIPVVVFILFVGVVLLQVPFFLLRGWWTAEFEDREHHPRGRMRS